MYLNGQFLSNWHNIEHYTLFKGRILCRTVKTHPFVEFSILLNMYICNIFALNVSWSNPNPKSKHRLSGKRKQDQIIFSHCHLLYFEFSLTRQRHPQLPSQWLWYPHGNQLLDLLRAKHVDASAELVEVIVPQALLHLIRALTTTSTQVNPLRYILLVSILFSYETKFQLWF